MSLFWAVLLLFLMSFFWNVLFLLAVLECTFLFLHVGRATYLDARDFSNSTWTLPFPSFHRSIDFPMAGKAFDAGSRKILCNRIFQTELKSVHHPYTPQSENYPSNHSSSPTKTKHGVVTRGNGEVITLSINHSPQDLYL